MDGDVTNLDLKRLRLLQKLLCTLNSHESVSSGWLPNRFLLADQLYCWCGFFWVHYTPSNSQFSNVWVEHLCAQMTVADTGTSNARRCCLVQSAWRAPGCRWVNMGMVGLVGRG